MAERPLTAEGQAQPQIPAGGVSTARLPSWFSSFLTLGVPVNAVQIPDAIEAMSRWIDAGGVARYVTVTGMHGLIEAQDDLELRRIFQSADLVVPDGMPLVWVGRLRGHNLRRRVYGPELMETFCAETGPAYNHYFYGGGPGVAERLAYTMSERHGIRVAGWYTPPFRDLTPEEDEEVIEAIDSSGAQIVWVGLSTPKQERWMAAHRDRVQAQVLVGVGAAFDFLSGTKSMAPRWMREHGLEWFYRLVTEPTRLWRRYLIGGARFLVLIAREQVLGSHVRL